jgi:hypothetical protein
VLIILKCFIKKTNSLKILPLFPLTRRINPIIFFSLFFKTKKSSFFESFRFIILFDTINLFSMAETALSFVLNTLKNVS